MANMSYCRFENTHSDLADCIEALENRGISSNRERNKAKKLIMAFLEFCEEEEIIENYDANRVDEIIEECKEEQEAE